MRRLLHWVALLLAMVLLARPAAGQVSPCSPNQNPLPQIGNANIRVLVNGRAVSNHSAMNAAFGSWLRWQSFWRDSLVEVEQVARFRGTCLPPEFFAAPPATPPAPPPPPPAPPPPSPPPPAAGTPWALELVEQRPLGDSTRYAVTVALTRTGTPLVGARVRWAVVGPHGGLSSAMASTDSSLTDALGRAVAGWRLTPGVLNQLVVRSDSAAPLTLTVTAPPAGTPPPAVPPPPPPPPGGGVAVVDPELPRATVDVSYPPLTGHSIAVPAGGSLQTALNSATCGDEVVLEAGATFVGNFLLPRKGCTGWIVLRSAGSLPAIGTRVTPAAAGQYARILTPSSGPALATENGARGYRIVGVEIGAQPAVTRAFALVTIHGTNPATLADIPADFILDRVYVHGHPTLDFQRCVTLNAARAALVDSYLSECHAKGFDSQALLVYNSPGPMLVDNNYLEGAGENLMFGGANPTITGLIPADLRVTRNFFFKPLAWKGQWTVKNLFEIKSAQRVLLEGNIFENTWVDGQSDAIVLKSAQEGGAPWSQASDVTFQYNIVRHAPRLMNIAAAPGAHPVVPAARFKVAHNLFEQIGQANGTTGPYAFTLLGGLRDIQITNNTLVNGVTTSLVSMDGNRSAGPPGDRLVMRDNHFWLGQYGINGSGVAQGEVALSAYWKTWDVTGNLWVTTRTLTNYPAGNTVATSIAAVPGKGADLAALAAKTAGVR